MSWTDLLRQLRKPDKEHEAYRSQRPFRSSPQSRSRGILIGLSFWRTSRLHPDMLPPFEYDSIILVKVAQTVVLKLIPFNL